MTSLIAKINLRGKKQKYRKLVTTDKQVYKSYESYIGSTYPYDPATTLDEEEWFAIENFSKTEFAIPLLTENVDSPNFDSIKRGEIGQVGYIFAKVGDVMYFQQVSKAKLVQKKCLFFVSGRLEYNDDAVSIPINDTPDAMYDRKNDKLYFQSIAGIKKIFPNIDQLYREATIGEVKEFLTLDCIQLENGFSADNVKIPNRKKIALAKDTLSKLNEEDRAAVFQYIGDYCPQIRMPTGGFSIGNEEDLRLFLFGVEQRFYTTIVGEEKRIANSIVTLL